MDLRLKVFVAYDRGQSAASVARQFGIAIRPSAKRCWSNLSHMLGEVLWSAGPQECANYFRAC